MSEVNVSVILPARNEAKNLPELMEEFGKLFEEIGCEYELVVVDDASTDETEKVLKELASKYRFLKCISHRTRQGKAGAIMSGFEVSKGDFVVIMDADLQYLPHDIPKLIDGLISEGYDVVSGWRQGYYPKGVASKIYNWLLKLLFNSPLHDSGATLALKREVLEEVSLHEEWHRYIIPFALSKGFKVGERKITLRPRKYGRSSYVGKKRLLIAFLDLLTVRMFVSFSKKPMLYFGTAGLFLLLVGAFFGLIYALHKLMPGLNFPWRLGATMTTFLLISGLFFILSGFIAEMLVDVKILLERLLKEIKEAKKGQKV